MSLPRGVDWLLRAGLPSDQREPIAGDVEEEYVARVRRDGVLRASLIVWWQAARLALTFRWERTSRGRPLPPIADEAPRRFTVFESMTQDALFAARLLRRQPGFTVVAVLMLALGVGATTAIFGIVDAVLWRPLPYPAADRVVSIAEQRPREGRLHGVVAPADFYDWRREAKSFAAMAAFEPVPLNLSGSGEPERIRAMMATPGLLGVVGMAPAAGRDFRAEEETPGKHRVVLMTDGLWRRRFGADAAIVGQRITLNGTSWMVIGVLPATFWWPAQPDVIIPYASVDGGDSMRALHSMDVVARLNAGVSFEQACAEMDAIGKRLSETYPQTNAAHFPHVIPLQEAMVGEVRPAMLMLVGAVALVLLIACANVATLLLAKATGRHREIGVRIALGAGRGRLVRQMLTESLLLAIVGGGAGLLVAAWSIATFRAILPAQFLGLPGVDRIGIDTRVTIVALVVSAVTGLVFGVIPALTASDQHAAATLHEHGRGGGAGARSGRVRAGLVIAEVALSLMLLVGAGLLLVSFKHLLDVSPGFEPRNLVTAPLALPGNRYDSHARIVAFYQALLERRRNAGRRVHGRRDRLAVQRQRFEKRLSDRGAHGTVPGAGPCELAAREPRLSHDARRAARARPLVQRPRRRGVTRRRHHQCGRSQTILAGRQSDRAPHHVCLRRAAAVDRDRRRRRRHQARRPRRRFESRSLPAAHAEQFLGSGARDDAGRAYARRCIGDGADDSSGRERDRQ